MSNNSSNKNKQIRPWDKYLDQEVTRRDLLRGVTAAGILGGTALLFQNCGGGFQTLSSSLDSGGQGKGGRPNPVNPVTPEPGPSPKPGTLVPPTRTTETVIKVNPSNPVGGPQPFLIGTIPVEKWSATQGTSYSQFEATFSRALANGNGKPNNLTGEIGILYVGLGSDVYNHAYLQQSFNSSKNYSGSDVSEILIFDKSSMKLIGKRTIQKSASNSALMIPDYNGAFADVTGVHNLDGISSAYQIFQDTEFGAGKAVIIVINDQKKGKYFCKAVSLDLGTASLSDYDYNTRITKAAAMARSSLNHMGGPGFLDVPGIAGRTDDANVGYGTVTANFSGHTAGVVISGNSITVSAVHTDAGSNHYFHSCYLFDQTGNVLKDSSGKPLLDSYGGVSGTLKSATFNNVNLDNVTIVRALVVDTFQGVVSGFARKV